MKLKYIVISMSIFLVSCTQQNKNRQQSKNSQQKTILGRERLKGYLDKTNNTWICENPIYETESFGDSLNQFASVTKMDANRNSIGLGLINRQGEIMVPPVYDGLRVGFTDGVCQVNKADKLGLVNLEGKEIVAPTYEYIDEQAVDGLLRVGKDDLYGMINLKGKVVIPLMYQDLRAAEEGMIAVMIEPQRWGYINQKNEMVVKPEFTYIDRFKNGKVILQKADGEDYIVYKNGKVEKK